MKNSFFKIALTIALLSMAIVFASCSHKDTEIAGSHTNLKVLLDSAKTLFQAFDALPNEQKLKKTEMLETSIALLTKVLKEVPKSAEANYYMGYASELELSGGTGVLNFNLINRENTETVSNYFETACADTSFVPDYKLSCKSKIANLWTTLALNYMIKGKTDSVETAFARADELGSFTPANVEYARNVLNDLDRNAILFVDTDLEISLFWFLQYMMNYRADVSVISTQMLDYQWYAKWLGFPANFTTTVQTGISDAELSKLYSDTSAITTAPRMNFAGSQITVIGRGKDSSQMVFPVNDLISLRIISHNIGNRPIYFTVNASKTLPHSIGLGNYISLSGLVVLLHKNIIGISESVDGQWIADRITNHYSFTEAAKQHSYTDRDFEFFSDIYRMMFDQEFYYFKGFSKEKEIPENIINVFNKVFPEKRFARTEEENKLLDL